MPKAKRTALILKSAFKSSSTSSYTSSQLNENDAESNAASPTESIADTNKSNTLPEKTSTLDKATAESPLNDSSIQTITEGPSSVQSMDEKETTEEKQLQAVEKPTIDAL